MSREPKWYELNYRSMSCDQLQTELLRLRTISHHLIENGQEEFLLGSIIKELRVEVDRLRAENKQLRVALQPFALWATNPTARPTSEDVARVLAALEPKP